MKKTVVNLSTGQTEEVTLSAQEEAQIIAEAQTADAINAPIIEKEQLERLEREDVKVSNYTDKLIKFNKNELNKYIKDNVTDLPSVIDYLEKLSLIVMVLAKREFK